MSKQHRVRTHHWNQGRLETKDHLFDNFNMAIEFARAFEGGICKVFNHLNEILSEHGSHHHHNTYA